MQKTSKSRHLYATLKSQLQVFIFVLLALVQLVYQPHLGYQRTAHLLITGRLMCLECFAMAPTPQWRCSNARSCWHDDDWSASGILVQFT